MSAGQLVGGPYDGLDYVAPMSAPTVEIIENLDDCAQQCPVDDVIDMIGWLNRKVRTRAAVYLLRDDGRYQFSGYRTVEP